MPASAPLGHLLPREGGRIPIHRLLIQMAFDTRMPLPRIRHFERKREIFFVRGKAKDVRGTTSGKHRTPCAPEERCFMQTDSRMKQKMANEKDPSAPLGMTIRETALLIFPFIPRRFQPPPLRGTSFHEKEGECRLHGLLMKKAMIREYRLPAFVISSECEKSFSFAARQRMRGQRKAGNTMLPANRKNGVSCKLIHV